MNKNSNTYQILYAAIMVVLVGAVLAFIYMALKPQQDENIANDKRRQILAAVHIVPPTESETGATFDVDKDLAEWMEEQRRKLWYRNGIKKAAIAAEIMTTAAFLIVLGIVMFYQ